MKKADLDRLAETLGGLPLLGCLRGSPSERAGLRYGDVVLEVNGHKTPDWWSFIEAVRVRLPVMKVRYFRDGAERVAELPLDPEPVTTSREGLLRELARNFIVPAGSDDDEPLLS